MPNPPVVAYLIGEYNKTTHTFIHREVRELRRQGLQLHTFTIRDTNDFPDPSYLTDEPDTETVLTFNPLKILYAQLFWLKRSPKQYCRALHAAWTLRSPGLRSKLYNFFYLLEATLFAQRATALGVTHFHNHFGDSAGNVVFIASRLTQIPFSITYHGPDVFPEAKKWHLDLKQKFAKFSVGTSHYATSQLMLHADPLGIEGSDDKLHVIRASLDLSEYVAQSRTTPPTPPWKLLFIARTAPAKGWQVILDAAQQLKKAARVPFSLSLVAAGAPKHLVSLRASIERRELNSCVQVISACPPAAINALISSHDILVSTSFAEGLPVVLIEAMALGKPVIATAVGGVCDLVRDNENGILVPPGRADLVVKAITDLTQSPETYSRLGEAARLEIQSGYQAQIEYGKLKALFDAH